MSDIFEPVVLTWKGQDYTIAAERCMRLIHTVEMALKQESKLQIFELAINPPVTCLAYSYAAALRFAGAEVRDEEVLQAIGAMFHDDPTVFHAAQGLLARCIAMILPPEPVAQGDPGAVEQAKKTTGG